MKTALWVLVLVLMALITQPAAKSAIAPPVIHPAPEPQIMNHRDITGNVMACSDLGNHAKWVFMQAKTGVPIKKVLIRGRTYLHKYVRELTHFVYDNQNDLTEHTVRLRVMGVCVSDWTGNLKT